MSPAALVAVPRIVCVVAARPNLMKMAPIYAALQGLAPAVALTLVHTGQHYDDAMSAQYFAALDLPAPDLNLDAGSASHAVQTADIMRRFEPVLDALAPAAVLVVGDVNSTLACALVAAKKQIAVIHVEAGLRSFDRAMPEEINRVLTDQLAELLFTSEASGMTNLRREGIAAQRIHGAGNVMIDCLRRQLARAVPADLTLARAGLAGLLAPGREYAVLTLHRPSNVDEPAQLASLMQTMVELSERLPLIFPVHPRTLVMLKRHGLMPLLRAPRLACLAPQGYLEMLGLMRGARLVLTDSGGVQEETTALGVPCLTLRDNTERPVTVSEGSNTLVGRQREAILGACDAVLRDGGKTGRVPEGWDGHAADRIAAAIGIWLKQRRAVMPVLPVASRSIDAENGADPEHALSGAILIIERDDVESSMESGNASAVAFAIKSNTGQIAGGAGSGLKPAGAPDTERSAATMAIAIKSDAERITGGAGGDVRHVSATGSQCSAAAMDAAP